MRKQSKSLLSMILTAAMVVSLGAGVTGEKSKAADATKIAPEFTAYLVQNNSKIFSGTGRVVKDSTGAVKQVDDWRIIVALFYADLHNLTRLCCIRRCFLCCLSCRYL